MSEKSLDIQPGPWGIKNGSNGEYSIDFGNLKLRRLDVSGSVQIVTLPNGETINLPDAITKIIADDVGVLKI